MLLNILLQKYRIPHLILLHTILKSWVKPTLLLPHRLHRLLLRHHKLWNRLVKIRLEPAFKDGRLDHVIDLLSSRMRRVVYVRL